MTAKKRSKTKVDTNAVSVESTALLGLLADIRAAVGDPTGKLMQDELVAHCRKLRSDYELAMAANCDVKRIADESWRMEQALKTLLRRHEEEIEGGRPISGEEWDVAAFALPNASRQGRREEKA